MSTTGKPQERQVADADMLLPHERGGLEPNREEDFLKAADAVLDTLDWDDDEEGAVSQDEEEESVSDKEVADDDSDEDDDADESDEDEAEEDEEDEEAEDEDDEDEGGDELFELPDGEKVARQELIDGYMRTKDYTRKTTEASEVVKTARARETEATGKVQELAKALEEVELVFTEMAGSPPDPALRAKDPGEYAAQREDYRARLGMIQAMRNRRNQLLTEAEKAMEQQIGELRTEELNKLSAARGYTGDQGKEAVGELEKFYTDPKGPYGFTAEEFKAAVDHRLLMALQDAKAHHDAQQKATEIKDRKSKKKPAKRAKARGVRSRGSQQQSRSQRSSKRLAEKSRRLSETGSVRDAADAIEELLGDEF